MVSRALRYLLAYIFIVLVFAFAYWFYWQKNTSNFIISEDLNSNTLTYSIYRWDLESFDSIDFFHTDTISFSTYGFNLLTNDIFKKINSVKSKLKILRKEYAHISNSQDSCYKLLMDSYANNIDEKVNNIKANFQRKKDSIVSLVMKYSSVEEKSLCMQKIFLDTLELNYEMILEEFKIHDIAITQMSTYYDKAIYKVYNEMRAVEDSVYDEIQKNIENQRNLIDDLLRLIGRYHGIRRSHLNFFDFIYFSLITATSTGYGDIVPNNRQVRALVVVEILVCLIIFGAFLNSLTTRSSPN
jgi:hypothetical protein